MDLLLELTTWTESALWKKKLIKVSHGRLVHVSKTLTDLHILGSELHLVAGLWLDPLPSDPLAIIRGGRRKGMKGWE